MAKWVERQSEFTGAFQIKLSATAVALLMCADNTALDQIQASRSFNTWATETQHNIWLAMEYEGKAVQRGIEPFQHVSEPWPCRSSIMPT